MSARARRGLVTRSIEVIISTARVYTRPTQGLANLTAPAPYSVRHPRGDDLTRIAIDLRGLIPDSKVSMIQRRAADPAFAVFLAVDGEQRICGFGHLEHDRVRDTHLGFDLGPTAGIAHLFDDFVAPAHRGRRLHGALTAARLAHAHRSGAPVASILVAESNHASRASVRRSGFETAFRVVTVRGPTGRRSWPLSLHARARLATAAPDLT